MTVLHSKLRLPFGTLGGIGKLGSYQPLHLSETLTSGLLQSGVTSVVLVITLGKASLTYRSYLTYPERILQGFQM